MTTNQFENNTTTPETVVEGVLVENNETLESAENVLVEGNEAQDAPVEEVKMTNAELKAAYAVLKETAKAAHDPATGKFTYETFADYKTRYNIQWDLAHPNPKDALPSTDEVLKTVNNAIGATTSTIVTTTATAGASKMSLAKAIFAAELAEKGAAGLVRKHILTRFQAEAGCTPAGANTYYNTCREKAGLVNHK